MLYSSAPFIVGVSLASSLFCEGVLWLLVYRTVSYQNMREILVRTTKKVESMKTASAMEKKNNKKLAKEEQFLKDMTRQLNTVKQKSNVVVVATLAILYSLMTSIFDGIPVGKLPFMPFGFVKTLCHRGLPGDDFTDCSMVFFYMTCSICNRANIQKFLGNAPPRNSHAAMPNFFAVPPPS